MQLPLASASLRVGFTELKISKPAPDNVETQPLSEEVANYVAQNLRDEPDPQNTSPQTKVGYSQYMPLHSSQ